ncbi:MAG: hypothetical protein RBT74_03075 [Tenuifilaceae bacterium]|jgi:hypothetical protein|nr:hypothetical protein [Tenuifilaceae bacterium]
MRKFWFTLLLASSVLLSSISVMAQFEQMKNKFDDVLLEIEEDIFTLRFANAITGDPVEGAQILLENIGEFTTDEEGKITFPRQPDGVIRVLFKKDKFIAAVFRVEVIAETIFFNRFSVSPIMSIDQFRVVLDWDQNPGDLDAHFVKANGYHISYRNTRVLADGTGMLDRDDLDGYGPETITVERVDSNGNYVYSVHNYSHEINSSAAPLSRSKATVRVYGNNRLLKSYQVPQNHQGKTWNVFRVENGQIVDL